jgi:hypothetical protein
MTRNIDQSKLFRMHQQFTFTQFDPNKKKKQKWTENIPLGLFQILTHKKEHKLQFKHFNLTEDVSKNKSISEVEEMNRQINQKLKGTNFTVEILEKLYNNDTMFHVLMDMKGNSIWFNTSFMELTGRCPMDLQKPNFVDISTKLNKEHPFTEILIHLLEEKPKEYKCKFSIFLKFSKSEFVGSCSFKFQKIFLHEPL